MANYSEFQKELQKLINVHSMENGSNTPDWILAEHLVSCLKQYDQSVIHREQYFGRQIQVANDSVGS